MIIRYLAFKRQSCRLYLEASILCEPRYPACWDYFVLLWQCLQPNLKYLKIVQKMVARRFMKINSEACGLNPFLSFKLSRFHSSGFLTPRRIPLGYKDVSSLTLFKKRWWLSKFGKFLLVWFSLTLFFFLQGQVWAQEPALKLLRCELCGFKCLFCR